MSKVYYHYATGAFSLWSKDADILIEVAGGKDGVGEG